ncbi:MAG: T9SS type A sorting domain-containing protein [Candidatus Marinimicrobia bacterium]|nr:T9SS type A sorting domain-containing protein [Candidatus Neomarinimicrobiota bacterium]MCF7827697.1 T9SS type A sorting domain-containing protein [Candidatus Neomarinimicrobiota bacterium]MCF7881248.1 T9SS type A sorting domain-containing protein [Candidatus Neomarinimicrobiota bacterium]
MKHYGSLFSGGARTLAKNIFVLSFLFVCIADIPVITAQIPGKSNVQLSGNFTVANNVVNGNHRLAIVRVDFQPDTSVLTTGDGTFDLSDTTTITDTIIDPPPHNAAYFKDQLVALHNYYSRVSNNTLTIDWQNSPIFPNDTDGAYTLSETMRGYGKGFADTTQESNWAKLLDETYDLTKGDVDFSQYSTLVIAHAGVGQDFDIPLDDSPFDIQSAYLDAEFLQDHFSDSRRAELENAGIEHVLILPETQSQLDIGIGLTGTFALLFGSRIGLPALYNTETGASVVGKFGLMDLGSNNANGIAPSYPSAWTRLYAGWDTAKTVNSSGDYSVQSPEAGGLEPTILKIPINHSEYYLVENRLRQIRSSSLDSFMVNFDTLFVERDPETHVITDVEEYDAGIPGDGLLIWHVDESQIQAGLAENAINTDPDRRAIDLEEADGAQDIGQYYGVFGGGRENGWFFDLWFAGNDGFFHLNPDYSTDADSTIGFTPETHPDSYTNSGTFSGIAITEIPAADSLVQVHVDFDLDVPGYPITGLASDPAHFLSLGYGSNHFLVSTAIGANTPDSLEVWIKNRNNIVTFPAGGVNRNIESIAGRINEQNQAVFGLLEVNSGVGPDSVFVETLTIENDGSLVQRSLLSGVAGRPVTQVIDDTTGYIFGTDHNQIHRVNTSGGADWVIEVPDSIKSISLTNNGNLYIGTENGLYLSTDGQDVVLRDEEPASELVTSGNEVYIRNDRGLRVYSANDISYVEAADQSAIQYHTIAAADMDADGRNELVALGQTETGEWRIFAYNNNDALVNNFPIDLDGDYRNLSFGVSDANLDGTPEIFAANDSGQIYGFASDGSTLSYFPIDIGEPVSAPLYFGSENNDHSVLVQGQSGQVYGYYSRPLKSGVEAGRTLWSGRNGNASNSRYVPASVLEPGTPDDKPIRRAYVYPNPIKSKFATFRIEVNAGDRILVSLYDFSGRFIRNWELNVHSNESVYEFAWSTSELPSGVYFGQVEVTGNGINQTEIVKVAITR